MTAEQLPLFPGDEPMPVGRHSGSAGFGLTASSRLTLAMERFERHMIRQDYAQNTVKSFLGDLRILKRYLKGDPPLQEISTKRLQDFMHWLQHERGKPCSLKSYARRLTTLKVFFSWLADVGVLASDPAAPLVHKPVQTPLPRILYDDQIAVVLAVTRQMMAGDPPHTKPDARPHLLVTLLLHTGIKKQECLGLKLSHIDTSDPAGPVIHVRYPQAGKEYKERRLRLPAGWNQALRAYLREYQPQEYLFPCTGRNLEYVLANVATLAGLPEGLSFEMLRWTCAVRDYQARMESDRLRRKLGLSQMSWQETEPRIVRLAEPPL